MAVPPLCKVPVTEIGFSTFLCKSRPNRPNALNTLHLPYNPVIKTLVECHYLSTSRLFPRLPTPFLLQRPICAISLSKHSQPHKGSILGALIPHVPHSMSSSLQPRHESLVRCKFRFLLLHESQTIQSKYYRRGVSRHHGSLPVHRSICVLYFRNGLVAVNLTLATFPSTRRRSSAAGGGVNSSPGQQAMAANSSPFRG